MFLPLLVRARKNHSKNYYNTVIADSPLGYWRLGESSGSTASDSGSGNNAGTYVSCTQGAATIVANNGGNLAVSGNGTSSQITVGAISSLYSLSRNCTIEAWIKPSTVSGTFGMWSAGLSGICIRRNNADIEFLSDYSASLHTFTVGMVAGNIYHIVFTIDSSGNTILYVNANSVGTFTTSTNFTGAYVRIGADGRDSTTVGNYLDGTIDEVAVYTTALSSARVSAHYTNGT